MSLDFSFWSLKQYSLPSPLDLGPPTYLQVFYSMMDDDRWDGVWIQTQLDVLFMLGVEVCAFAVKPSVIDEDDIHMFSACSLREHF